MNFLKATITRRAGHLRLTSVDQLLASNKVVAFIHGTEETPLCHKSKMVVEALKFYNQVFTCVNLLEAKTIRKELLSKYPFTPQVFSRGTLIGGAYSLLEFHENGVLRDKLK